MKRTIYGIILLLLGASPTVFAVPLVTVGNGTASPDGSYLNAVNIASLLAFTNDAIAATNQIIYADSVNLANTVQFGPTFFDLNNTAPTLTIDNNVKWNVAPNTGTFKANSAQVNLLGSFYDTSNALVGPTHLSGNATSVSVLSMR